MPRKRSSKRRSSPFAALVAVLILGGTAIALETYTTPQIESQTAAVLATSHGGAPAGGTPAPAGSTQTPAGTETAECMEGVDYRVRLISGKPQIHCTLKFQCPKQGFPTNMHGCDKIEPQPFPAKKTIFTQEETTRCNTPSAGDLSQVYYCLPKELTAGGNEEECKRISHCVPGGGKVDGNTITTVNHQSMVAAQQALAPNPTRSIEIERNNNEILDRTPSSLSEGILAGFNPETPASPSPTPTIEYGNGGQVPLQWPGTETPTAPIPNSVEPLQGDMLKPNLGPAGGVTPPSTETNEPPKKEETFSSNCPGPNCRAGAWDPPAEQRPPAQQCSGMQRFFGGCPTAGGPGSGGGNLLSSLFGGQPQQQMQCGYVNGQYICRQQQQCSPIQQMISGCPNMFGQQQCGGLMLMLNKCPAGSYNPNNPSNPYNYPQPTCTINVSPQNAQQGQAVTIQWQSQNAQYANISGLGQVGPAGSTTAYPQGPMTYSMSVVGYGNQQGQCQAQYGGGNNGGGGTGTGEPIAEISCQPLKADVGMQVALSYACQNSTTSVGSGFSTGGALSGSSIVTVANPSFGQHTANYGLTCTNQGKTHSAQCTIDVNKAAIVMVAVPKSVQSGGAANIAWVTSGMDSCTVSTTGTGTSTISATSTPTAGSISTGPLTVSTEFGLTCITKVGSTKVASTTVGVSN